MSEPGSLLHVKAAGMDLLLLTADIREVAAPTVISPIPGHPPGIQGVVVHQGEFLPVLAWGDLPGVKGPPGPPVALVVLRPRLGLPVERIIGMIQPPGKGWKELPDADPASSWQGGRCRIRGREFRLLDPDRLVSLLRRFKGER